jgi:hypothetical protein
MLLSMRDLAILACAAIAAFVMYTIIGGATGDWTAIGICLAGFVYGGERIAHNRKKLGK